VRVSLEFKPTDAATRFSIVPNTAAALLLLRDVNAPNLGLTLDLGHLLLAGENPGQSVAAVAAAGRLWGLHLNDAHVRLGAEDGLPFGSVNPRAGEIG
jgi:sugar phosphate isomerase/epimerase